MGKLENKRTIRRRPLDIITILMAFPPIQIKRAWGRREEELRIKTFLELRHKR
jgi:hypothetical protein